MGKSPQHIRYVQMLQQSPAQNQVKGRIWEFYAVTYNIPFDEMPTETGELLQVMMNYVGYDVHSRVVNVVTGLQKTTHPCHITTRHVKQPNALDAQQLLQLSDD